MKLTKAQQTDLDLCLYFMPKGLHHISLTNEDKAKYLAWSEQGKHKEDIKQSHFSDGFNALISAKQWRGRTIHELWEHGILEGTVPYFTLLGGEDETEILPRYVVDFMKKEMFKGIDAEIIEKYYQSILKEVTNH